MQDKTKPLSGIHKTLLGVALAGLVVLLLWLSTCGPWVRSIEEEVIEKEVERIEQQVTQLGKQNPRISLRLEPNQTSRLFEVPRGAIWWGWNSTETCVDFILNGSIIHESCPNPNGVENIDEYGVTLKTLQVRAQDELADVLLHAEFERIAVNLSPDNPSIKLVTEPGKYFSISIYENIRVRPRGLTWSSKDACASLMSNDGVVVTSCPGETHTHKELKKLRGFSLRANDHTTSVTTFTVTY